jgi:HK97 family phage major capsid protein
MITQGMRKKLAELFGDNVNLKADADLEKLIVQAIRAKKISAAEAVALNGQKGAKTVVKKIKSAPLKKPAGKAASVHVKKPSARYSEKKYTAKNRHGQPVMVGNKEAETVSEKEAALCGVFVKHLAARSGMYPGVILNEHERELLKELTHEEEWAEFDPSGGEKSAWWEKASAPRVKALLDDTTSGGLYANPIAFDNAIVMPALLNGELYPAVNVVDLPRGRRIEAAKLGIPTAQWGVFEGTPVTAFDTTALVSQITGTIFAVSVYLELGLDLLADAPVDVGNLVLQQVSQRMQTELDRVIGSGNGTSEPEGIFTAGSTAASNSDNSTSGPGTVGDIERLMASVGKQYTQAPYAPFFVCNQTTYQRYSAISVGPLDERRMFGNTASIGGVQDRPNYKWFEMAVKIQNDIANGKIAMLPGQAYRMWRRGGFETMISREGDYFMKRAMQGLLVRGRFGGKIVLPEAVATQIDGQS